MGFELDQVREIVERVATPSGLEVVEVDLRGSGKARMLRIVIDKLSGVTHEDCANLSREVGTILDVEDVIPGNSYLLEVSSPGLDRKLTKPSDFSYFVGRRARLVLKEAMGEQKVLEGRLAGFENGRVRLDLGEHGLEEFELANIRKAQLVVEV